MSSTNRQQQSTYVDLDRHGDALSRRAMHVRVKETDDYKVCVSAWALFCCLSLVRDHSPSLCLCVWAYIYIYVSHEYRRTFVDAQVKMMNMQCGASRYFPVPWPHIF